VPVITKFIKWCLDETIIKFLDVVIPSLLIGDFIVKNSRIPFGASKDNMWVHVPFLQKEVS
jgi:hypothetical protein